MSAQQYLETISEAAQKYEEGKTEEAINLLRLAVSSEPEFVDAKLFLGQIYLETSQFEKAKVILSDCVALANGNAEAHYSLGLAYLNLDEFENALSEFGKTKKISPAHENLPQLISICYLNLGVIEYQKNDKRKAAKRFQKAIESDKKNIQAYRNLAATLYEIGEKEKTEKVIKRALKISPKEKTLLKMQIQIYADKNKPEKAQKAAEKYYEYFPEDTDGALRLAYLYRFNNQGDKAFAVYETALKNAPDDMRIYDDYAELFRYRGKFDKAVAVYEKALKRFADKASIYFKIGEIYKEFEKYDDARREYRNALSAKGDIAKIYLRISDTYLSEKNKSSAADVLREGIKLSPDNWALHIKLGTVLEDYSAQEAIITYNGMQTLRVGSSYPFERLCAVYSKMDSLKSACENCLRAIELKTESPSPFHLYAKLKLAKQDTLEALKNEKIAIEKSLKLISKYRSKYLKKINEGVRSFSGENIEQIKDDNKTAENAREILKESLENYLNVGYPEEFENQLNCWRKDFPKNTTIIEFLGKNFERTKNRDKAFASYKELIRLDAEEIEGHLGMARILESEGKTNEAVLAYKRALTIDTENNEIYAKLIELNKKSGELEKLISDWLLLEKREPENVALLKNLATVLKMGNRNNEFLRVEKKLKNAASEEKETNEETIQFNIDK